MQGHASMEILGEINIEEKPNMSLKFFTIF